MSVMTLNGGPFFIAKRKNERQGWQVYENGFGTEDEAWSYINAYPDHVKWQWSVLDIRTVKPKAVYSGPAGKA
jgi:hypothetical protein